MRKLAREAIIFALIGMLVGAVGAFALPAKDIRTSARLAGAEAVHAFFLQPGESIGPFPEAQPILQVPLTNGTILYVRVCPLNIFEQAAAQPCRFVTLDHSALKPIFDPDHPHQTVPPPKPPPGFIPEPVTILGGWVTLSAADYQNVSDARTFAVPIGDVNQIAIEKDYWAAYTESEHATLF